MQTPVHRDGSIDTEGLKRLIEFLTGKGVGGFWALGTGSEDMNLSFEKRLSVARTITTANAGRLPLILGSGFFAMDDILAFMDATKELNFDAYHVMPYHPLMGLDGMEKFYRDIADHAPKPLWMYTSANWCRAFRRNSSRTSKAIPISPASNSLRAAPPTRSRSSALQRRNFQVITAVACQFIMVLRSAWRQHHEPGGRVARAVYRYLQPVSPGQARRSACCAAQVQ